MTPDKQFRPKPTLEDLLRVKRAERPDESFWQDFEHGMRQKQLAAIIEPRPWWLGLATIGRRLAPVGLPVSAGAMALVALLAMRVSPVGGLAEADAPKIAAVEPALATSLTDETPASVPAALAPSLASTSDQTEIALASLDASVTSDLAAPLAATPDTATLPSPLELADATDSTPTETLLAATVPAPVEPASDTSATAVVSNPVPAEVTSSRLTLDHGMVSLAGLVDADLLDISALDPRQERLLVAATEIEEGKSLSSVRERVLHRLTDDESRYDSISRLGLNADRLSLKF